MIRISNVVGRFNFKPHSISHSVRLHDEVLPVGLVGSRFN